MPEDPALHRALAVTVALLIAAAVTLGGAAVLRWAWIDFQVPKRGLVTVGVDGSEVLPALTPLAVLALAAVAAVLAIGGWARRLLGGLLLVAAVPPILGVLQALDEGWLTAAAMSAAGWPAGSVHAETTTMLPAGPGFAAGGAILLITAGVALVVRGHRMPRLGRRYQAPSSRRSAPEDGLWARMDAGEDPTVSGHPR
ncbi:MAG: Trp biosynthesis-associated membrane protein [Actinomycetota bacterium]|nr:Trp biosynthesis-associated membrane protein [Actinomycetota bacterium]